MIVLEHTSGIEVFSHPTVRELSRLIDSKRASVLANGGAERAAASRPHLVRKHDSVNASGQYKPSFAQEQMLVLYELDPASVAYAVPWTVRIAGALRTDALVAALRTIAVRHDILRTTYAKSGAGLRAVVVPADVFELDVAVHDVRERANGDSHVSAMSAATSLLAEEVARRFDLYGGAALRVVLVQTGDEEHVLLVNAHHICTDEWSVNVLWRELHTLYAALAASTRRDDDDANRSDVEARATLPEPAVQYSDYAAWQRSWFEGGGREEWTRQLDTWAKRL